MTHPEIYVQFPDLSEVHVGSLYSDIASSIFLTDNLLTTSYLKTEFCFAVSAPGASERSIEILKKIGFKNLSSMKNWWPSHVLEKERTLRFWWKKTGIKEPCLGSMRKIWKSYSYNDEHKFHFEHMAYTGCGFKIGELPLRAVRFHQYFTLMRLPLQLVGFQRKWLERYHFRHIDTGISSQYWINGWNPEEYTETMEMSYWKAYEDKNKAIAKARSCSMDR